MNVGDAPPERPADPEPASPSGPVLPPPSAPGVSSSLDWASGPDSLWVADRARGLIHYDGKGWDLVWLVGDLALLRLKVKKTSGGVK